MVEEMQGGERGLITREDWEKFVERTKGDLYPESLSGMTSFPSREVSGEGIISSLQQLLNSIELKPDERAVIERIRDRLSTRSI